MQADEPPELCAGCRFWERREHGATGWSGFCRRHAPPAVTISAPGEFEARWPVTHESEWCGEWRCPMIPAPNRTPREDIVFVAR